MNTAKAISKHLNDVFFGGNWTAVNVQSVMQDVDLKTATHQHHDLNTIAVLFNHITYYTEAQLSVLCGNNLDAKDELSFSHPNFQSNAEWKGFIESRLQNVKDLVRKIEKLPESQIATYFVDEKYGSYYRNLNGLIEHTHYHLGQISLLKKLYQQ